MNSFVNYILESGVSLGVLALIYFVFLRNQTFFKANRWFLLLAIVFSSVLPLLQFNVWETQRGIPLALGGTSQMLETITVTSTGVSNSLIHWLTSSEALITIYFIVGASLLMLTLWRILLLVRLIFRHQQEYKDGINFVYLNDNSSPYSFLNYLFLGKYLKNTSGWEKMLAHESEHIRQKHTVDILILEFMAIVQWFNPFFWLLRRVIKENHEYMADQAVLNKGVAVQQYKKVLVTQFIGSQFSVANNFNSSLIKSRLKMMTKIKSSKKANFRYLIGILAVAALLVVFACEKKESSAEAFKEETELKSAPMGDQLILIDGEVSDIETMNKIVPAEIETIEVLKGADNPFIESHGEKAKNGVINITMKSGAIDAQNTDPEGIVVTGLGVSSSESSDPVHTLVDEMPEFPGGDLALRKFIAQSIKYPVSAQENGIQGKVYVTFVVEKDGSVGRTKIARGVDTALDYEALRVMNQSPKWTPGKQDGKPVAVSYTVPISFVLQ